MLDTDTLSPDTLSPDALKLARRIDGLGDNMMHTVIIHKLNGCISWWVMGQSVRIENEEDVPRLRIKRSDAPAPLDAQTE